MAKLPNGLLVAIEGIDGAGKTTQVRLLGLQLRSTNLEHVLSKEPTDGPHGRRIRESARTGRMSPADELAAFVADRRQHVQELIAPALAAGKVVVVDRYYFSTAAYQGARGLDFDEIVALNESFAPVPDLLVILEVPATLGVGRVRSRGDDPNLFEEIRYLEECARLFARIQAGDKVLRLDGTAGEQDIHAQILRRVRSLIVSRLPSALLPLLL